MKMRPLGATGVSVSELCFGTMSFGDEADEGTSAAMYTACRNAGINLFDCADMYADGKSEEILGRLAEGHRDQLVLTTKCFGPVLQPMYNLVKCQAEVEILPMAEANGLGVIPYSPAAAGPLSGKYFGQGSGRLTTNKRYEARYGEPWMYEVAEKYVAFCKQRGLHPVSTSIAWVAAHPGVTAPIIGARNLEQLKDSLASVAVDMTPDLRAEIADLSRAPPPATDRLEEVRTATSAAIGHDKSTLVKAEE
jgi:aryl-alcohol dehydrogenase-like predicted oxidoreductase